MDEQTAHIVNLPVETRTGQYLGRVRSVEIDRVAGTVLRLYVRPSWLKRLWYPQFIIHRNQIVRITENKVVVEDTVTPIRSWRKAELTSSLSAAK